MKKKIIPMLLSLAIALSFSLVGADLGLAADSMKDSVKPITNSSFQTANLDVKGFTAKDAPIKRIKAGSTAYLPLGVEALVSYGNSTASKTTWLKIRPVASGFISTSSYAKSTMQLCNAKKKALSPVRKVGAIYTSKPLQEVTFGVKAKTTYYLKLKGSGMYSSALNEYATVVLAENYKCTGKYGKTARKAAKLTREKYRYGFLQTTSKAKYYRINKRGKKIDITLPIKTDGAIKATVTVTAPGMKKFRRTYTLTRNKGLGTIRLYNISGKTHNMKCIVKIYRSGKSSGGFGIMYK